ncbi:hypothetical protein [Microbulbifer sp. PAAF003]|uniref:hypothetical protein n=1 Tax=Microbulbifer sp. PAAF003 TaxID=3243375 RepID=UPI00403A52B0
MNWKIFSIAGWVSCLGLATIIYFKDPAITAKEEFKVNAQPTKLEGLSPKSIKADKTYNTGSIAAEDAIEIAVNDLQLEPVAAKEVIHKNISTFESTEIFDRVREQMSNEALFSLDNIESFECNKGECNFVTNFTSDELNLTFHRAEHIQNLARASAKEVLGPEYSPFISIDNIETAGDGNTRVEYRLFAHRLVDQDHVQNVLDALEAAQKLEAANPQ